MSEKIVRTKTRASGGVTKEELAKMEVHSKVWIERALYTGHIQPDKIIPAIKGLYRVSDLKEPQVVIVQSPLVMAYAGGFSQILRECKVDVSGLGLTEGDPHKAKDGSTTFAHILNATVAAVNGGQDGWAKSYALPAKLRKAADSRDFGALAAFLGGEKLASKMMDEAAEWSSHYQGGNMFAGWDCYLTACRDILGLDLPEHKNYAFWEQAAIHGGFRYLREDFCMVCDFPEILLTDEENRPHGENGPSHRWRDGWALYYWHGTNVPAHWIEDTKNVDPLEVLKTENVEQRTAGISIVGIGQMLEVLEHEVLDDPGDPDIGKLVSVTAPGLDEPGLYLIAECPRNGTIGEGVPNVNEIDGSQITTAIAAQAWRDGKTVQNYIHPEQRT